MQKGVFVKLSLLVCCISECFCQTNTTYVSAEFQLKCLTHPNTSVTICRKTLKDWDNRHAYFLDIRKHGNVKLRTVTMGGTYCDPYTDQRGVDSMRRGFVLKMFLVDWPKLLRILQIHYKKYKNQMSFFTPCLKYTPNLTISSQQVYMVIKQTSWD